MNMSCRSSVAPSIQLLKGAALLAYSKYSWSIISSCFSVLCLTDEQRKCFCFVLFQKIKIKKSNNQQEQNESIQVLPQGTLCDFEWVLPMLPTGHRSLHSDCWHWESHSSPDHYKREREKSKTRKSIKHLNDSVCSFAAVFFLFFIYPLLEFLCNGSNLLHAVLMGSQVTLKGLVFA